MASWEDAYREALRQRPNAPANPGVTLNSGADAMRQQIGQPNIVPDPASTERRQPAAGTPWVQGGTNQQWNAIPTPGAQPSAPAAQQPTAQPAGGMDPNASWGGFGTYGNWAPQFAAQHGGRQPNKQDEADFWWSQQFANQYGRPPSYGEWVNKWETGEPNQSMPWQLKAGTPYYGEPFQNMRGSAMPAQYRNAVASPGSLPQWMQQGFVPWYQGMMGGQGAPMAQPAAQPPQQAPQVPQMGGQMAEPEWWQRGPGIVGRR